MRHVLSTDSCGVFQRFFEFHEHALVGLQASADHRHTRQATDTEKGR